MVPIGAAVETYSRVITILRWTLPTPPAQPVVRDKRTRSDRVVRPAELQNMADVIGDLMNLLHDRKPVIRVTLEFDADAVHDLTSESRLNDLLNSISAGWAIDN